jgi:type I restriction enzyme S subunit
MKAKKVVPLLEDNPINNYESSKGWEIKKLKDITKKVSTIKPETDPERIFGYVDISSINNKTNKIVEFKNIRGKAAPSRARQSIQQNDVLFSNVRTYLRNIAIVPDDLDVQVCSTGFTVLRSNGTIVPKFLFYYTLTNDFINKVTPQQTGSQYPATTDRVVKDATIPLPPLAEQHRIVARVEALLSQINAARDRLNRVPLIMKRFRQAVLAAACSGRLTEGWREENPAIEPAEKYLCHLNNEQKIKIKQKNEGIDVDSEYELPINWIYVCLDNILEKNRAIRYGVLKPGIDDPNGIRLIKSGQVRDGFMDLTEIYRITRDLDQQYSRTRLQGGELLLNLVGASIGRSAIAPNELRGANVSRAIAVIPILNSHSKYVQLSLQGPIGQKLIQSKTGGTAQPVLNLEEVRKLLIPLPPLSELDEIIRRVETLFTLADKIEQEVAEAMKRTEALTQAVLAKAFRGELVEREVESNEVHPT